MQKPNWTHASADPSLPLSASTADFKPIQVEDYCVNQQYSQFGTTSQGPPTRRLLRLLARAMFREITYLDTFVDLIVLHDDIIDPVKEVRVVAGKASDNKSNELSSF